MLFLTEHNKNTRPPRRKSGLYGEMMIWLCGGALSLNLLLVFCLVGLLCVNGLGYFWQKPIIAFEFADGRKTLAEIHDREAVPQTDPAAPVLYRIKIRNANVDLGGVDFEWIDESKIVRREEPANAAVIERLDWSPFIGYPREIRRGAEVLGREGPEFVNLMNGLLSSTIAGREQILQFSRGPLGDVDREITELTIQKRAILKKETESAARSEKIAKLEAELQTRIQNHELLSKKLVTMREELLRETLVVETATGVKKEIPLGSVARITFANQLGTSGRLQLYISKIREFLFDEPRNLNTEGGIFPAIFGTILMVFLMSIAVVPLGVLAALYLREYAKQGIIVRLVRIAVNNLAGVPSIVFGMFGLGFFVYTIGGSIDQLFYSDRLPAATYGTGGILWASLTLALLTVPVVIVAAEEGLAAVPRIVREGSLALGATKFETTWRVVLPAAAPGILTGLILAMARAAGEVAPLMVVGMVKLASALPFDTTPPFIHPERKFMYLGFHIYDIGFQNKNVDATKPLVYATAFLLIAIVTIMNLVAISLRNHLRKKYSGASV